MRTALSTTLVVVMLVFGLVPALADGTDMARDGQPDDVGGPPETTTPPETTILQDTVLPDGIDGPPLVINGRTYSPELICAGVDGAVIFDDEDDGIRYIAGFEDGPFLRVILSDGHVLETRDVTLTDDPSGAYARGILEGEFPEAKITMYLDEGLAPCPELR